MKIQSLMVFLAALIGGVVFSSRWAHSANEPVEPLLAALPARHPPVVSGGGYVGAQSCAECHPAEYRHWQGSQHAQAMQPATEQTVLGDFKDASFTYAGVTSTTFFRRDGKFMVRTDRPEGGLQDFEIAHTFGVHPLQQYLIGFPDGRYQMLGIAWDSRPKQQGGQRWFHLYPDQNLTYRDPLHWTGLQQNWNYMCAECHSTHLRKNYDAKLNRFNTTWSEINVSCEACHGPGADHLAWARKEGDWQKLDRTQGLAIALDERRLAG